MSIVSGSECVPMFGASWQVPQVPTITAGLPSAGLSFSPCTSVICIGALLKMSSPRAMLACAGFALPSHAETA